jgi:phenylacetate-CoA ligase
VIGDFLEFHRIMQIPKKDPDEIAAIQLRKLQTIVEHAYGQVPYYRSLFDSVGLKPADIRSVEDLKHVPVTTRDDLQQAGKENLLARNVNRSDCISAITSGSTGKPLTAWYSMADMKTYRMIGFRALLSTGFRPWDRLALVGITRSQKVKLYQRLGIFRSIFIQPLLPLSEQCELIRKMNPTVLWFYPTALRALLHFTDGRLADLVRPRIMISGAEMLDDQLRMRVEKELGSKIYNFYGAIETGRIASECKVHEGLHINMDYIVLECLNNVGMSGATLSNAGPAKQGQPGVAVVTTLENFTMPLIRYRLGDLYTFLDGSCSCGSNFQRISPPHGKDESLIRLPGGGVLIPQGAFTLLRQFRDLHQFRLIQESLDHIVLLLVWLRPPQKGDLAKIRAQLNEFLGEPVQLDIQCVDEIPEEKLKFRTFISKLPKMQ